MKGLSHNIVFIIATWMFLSASAITAVSAGVGTDIGDNIVSVESNLDNTEVTDRDKIGTSLPSNFALVLQAKKKQALTRRACLQAETSGHH